MDNAVAGLVTIATAIVGVAILAVLVSKNSQTPAVFTAGGNAFAAALSAATGPVTGSNYGSGLSPLTSLNGLG